MFRGRERSPEIPPARPIGSRGHSRGRAGPRLRRPGERRGVRDRRQGPAAGALAEPVALVGREPPAVRLLARAAPPEGPERLPALRTPHAGGGGIRRMRRPLAIGLCLVALGVAGCGGDDEPAETLPSPPELTVPQDKDGPDPADTE